jgi:hypothetical protein
MPILDLSGIRFPTKEEEEQARRFQVVKNYLLNFYEYLSWHYGGEGTTIEKLLTTQRPQVAHCGYRLSPAHSLTTSLGTVSAVMDPIPIDQLRDVDERARVFAGSFPGGERTTDATVVRRHQERIKNTDLVSAVPGSVIDNFERLRTMHTYGALAYDLYSVVEQTHAFVLEQALGERFIEFYAGLIPFGNKDGKSIPLRASTFREVHAAVSRKGSHYNSRCLHLPARSDPITFSSSFYSLLSWARGMGFLRGQQNRFREDLKRQLRNEFAHPKDHSLVGPIDSANAICTLAEIINHLWGATTPGGGRYPPPVVREVLILGRAQSGDSRSLGYPVAMSEGQVHDDWEYYVVCGYRHDGALLDAEPPFERTNIPTELLWGPGPARAAMEWIDANDPQPDTVDHLDRLFFIGLRGGRPEYPEPIDRLEAGRLKQGGFEESFTIRADFPGHALGHVRGLLEPRTRHSSKGYCPECPTETIAAGEIGREVGHLRR